MNLVDKFKAVQVKHESVLPEEDIGYCQNQKDKALAALMQLERWRLMLHCADDAEPNPAFTLKEGYRDEIEVREEFRYSSANAQNEYTHLMFSPKFGIAKIDKLKRAVKSAFIIRIFHYFRDKYSIEIRVPDTDNKYLNKYTPDYMHIIEDIKKQNGGSLDFKEVAVKRHIEKFRQEVYWSTRAELKGQHLTLHDFIWYETNYGTSALRFDSDGKKLNILNAAISIFEKDEVIDYYAIGSYVYRSDVNFGSAYEVHCTRIKSIKFYKNRKIIITFNSIQDASDFYNRFELATLPKR